jgi:hypothetical protein
LDVSPVVFVETGDVIERVRPRNSFIPKTEVKLVTHSFVVRPVSNTLRAIDTFKELMR